MSGPRLCFSLSFFSFLFEQDSDHTVQRRRTLQLQTNAAERRDGNQYKGRSADMTFPRTFSSSVDGVADWNAWLDQPDQNPGPLTEISQAVLLRHPCLQCRLSRPRQARLPPSCQPYKHTGKQGYISTYCFTYLVCMLRTLDDDASILTFACLIMTEHITGEGKNN